MPQNPANNDPGSLDIEQILKILPHRYPFLLVDRVLEIKHGKSLKAVKNVTCNEPFFVGHFPKIKVMPGVLILEAIAQAGAILIIRTFPPEHDRLVLLSTVENAKFRKPVIPGDQLLLEVEVTKLKSRFGMIVGRALVDGEVAVQCEMMAYFGPREAVNVRG